VSPGPLSLLLLLLLLLFGLPSSFMKPLSFPPLLGPSFEPCVGQTYLRWYMFGLFSFLPNHGFTLSLCYMMLWPKWVHGLWSQLKKIENIYICNQPMPWLHSSSCTHISPFVPYWQWNSTSQMIWSLRSCLLISLWIKFYEVLLQLVVFGKGGPSEIDIMGLIT
jgi:hypothetical protein